MKSERGGSLRTQEGRVAPARSTVFGKSRVNPIEERRGAFVRSRHLEQLFKTVPKSHFVQPA